MLYLFNPIESFLFLIFCPENVLLNASKETVDLQEASSLFWCLIITAELMYTQDRHEKRFDGSVPLSIGYKSKLTYGKKTENQAVEGIDSLHFGVLNLTE